MPDRTPQEAKAHILQLEQDLAACMLHAQRLEEALANRDVIGQAKGIIMSATGKDADSAFAMLVQISQRLNEKLRFVAERIAAESRREPPHDKARSEGSTYSPSALS